MIDFLNPTAGKWVFSRLWRSLPAQLPSPLTFKIDRVWCGFNQVLNVNRLLARGLGGGGQMGQGIWVGTCLSEEALRFAGWLSLLAKHARHFTANNHVPFSIESFIGGTRDRWVDAESLGVWGGTTVSNLGFS